MVYPWVCSACEQITDVQRLSKDIDIPPEKCDHCPSTAFKFRAIVRDDPLVNQFIKADTGVGWPGHGFYAKPYWPEKK